MTKFNYLLNLIKENCAIHCPLMAFELGNSISVVQVRLRQAACECFKEGGLIFDCVS